MEEQRPESSFIKRHRMSALWNGVIIGMGIFSILYMNIVIGVVVLAVGSGVEVIQRKRLDRLQ